MINDTLWVHAGGGWLRTLNDGFELTDLTQRGNEYGGGFQWSLDPRINLYGEYWKYNVSGADGFDDSSLCIGVEYITQKNFTIGLEYQTDDGEFDDITDLNYDAKLLLLKTTYNW